MKINNNLARENKKKVAELIAAKNKKPQFGNSRSFACNSKRKIWKCNKQKVIFNKKTYFLPQKEIKTIRKKLKIKSSKNYKKCNLSKF